MLSHIILMFNVLSEVILIDEVFCYLLCNGMKLYLFELLIKRQIKTNINSIG
jgi:hypothetical protein